MEKCSKNEEENKTQETFEVGEDIKRKEKLKEAAKKEADTNHEENIREILRLEIEMMKTKNKR